MYGIWPSYLRIEVLLRVDRRQGGALSTVGFPLEKFGTTPSGNVFFNLQSH